MIKWPLSLFSRLYFSVALVIICCVIIGQFVDEYFDRKDDFKYFKRNVSYIVETMIHKDLAELEQQNDFLSTMTTIGFGLSVKFIERKNEISPCENCNYLTTIGSIQFYELEEGEFFADYRLLKAKRHLIIYEMLDEERQDDDLPFYHDEVDSLIFLITSLLLMSITLYRPVKNLQRQINTLNQAHQKFGSGDMKARASERVHPPLDKLALSFNYMADAIDKSVKERDIFSHAIPHEVRTPLSRIQLAAGLIRQKSKDDETLSLIDDVDNYIDDINELISQIVEFSKLTSFKSDEYFEQYQTISMRDFIAVRLKHFSAPEDKVVNVNICEKAQLTTNPVYLRLALDNLVKNALTYANTAIEINVFSDETSLVLSVEDDGSGINETDRETIFIPFSRLDQSRNRKTGGLGLGLAITKAATEKMHGTITVSRSFAGGAKFLITIPQLN